jgi:3,4-dihydroxy 2-butanone 4-phosphate synthase / GTP cyclohydrolase II
LSNRVIKEAEANLPTSFGEFQMIGYRDTELNTEHIAIISKLDSLSDVPVRIHSECLTGEAFGSLKCECGPQLDYALDYISNSANGGVIIYLRGHEGRGIGLINKIKAYSLQDEGYDTVEANLELGLPSEAREYGAAVEILKSLGINSVQLLSNNPEKSKFLIDAGIPVTKYIPVHVGVAAENINYLNTKRDKMGHSLPEKL